MNTNRKYTEDDLRTVMRLDDFARHVILNSLERGFYPFFVAVGRRNGFRCAHCGASGNDLELDHIMPVSLGGSNKPDNLQILCHSCNAAKSDRL